MTPESCAIPLDGADPDLPAAGLEPLLRRLDGARLVGLGEATHGDRESFLFKHRLIRELVRRRGVRLVIFERGAAEMDAYDRYVTGTGDDAGGAPPLGPELYPWRTEEVRDLFGWLRAWNAHAPPGAVVRLAGMDMQSPRGLALAVELLDEAGLPAPDAWRRLADEVSGRDGAHRADWDAAALAAWCGAAWPVLDPVDSHHRWIALLADTFRQWLEHRLLRRGRGSTGGDRGAERALLLLRDRFMAANALAQLTRFGPDPDAAAVVWAHNDHVATFPGFPLAGRHLRAALGRAYRAVGFACGGGRFNAGTAEADGSGVDWTLRPHGAQPPPPGSMEAVLDSLGGDHTAIAPADAAPLRSPVRRRTVGTPHAAAWDQFRDWVVPADAFDLLVYFRCVHPSRVLGAGPDASA